MTKGRNYGVTVLRVTLGVVFMMHGYLGGFVFTPSGMTAFNASKGIPLPAVTAWFVILGHFLGGASLVLGYFARLGAFVHVVIMGGAVFFAHLDQGFFMHGIIIDAEAAKATAGGFEYPLVLLMASVAILFLGSGPLAMDRSWR